MVTEIPAAVFAKITDLIILYPSAIATARAPLNASPAPVVSIVFAIFIASICWKPFLEQISAIDNLVKDLPEIEIT